MPSSPSSSTITLTTIISAFEERRGDLIHFFPYGIDPSNGCVVDDSCVFGAEVFVIKSQRINECLSLLKSNAPFKREWKLLSHLSKFEGVWLSEEFSVGDHKWKVQLYPKGNTSKVKEGYLSMYLLCVDSKSFGPYEKVKADITLRVKSKIHDLTTLRTIIIGLHHHLLKLGDLLNLYRLHDMSSRDFLVDDCCFPEVEMSLKYSADYYY